MSTVKITKRERYESIMALCETVGAVEGFDMDGIVAFCQKEVDALAARAQKAKDRSAEKRAEGDELQAAVLKALTDELATRQEIADRVDPSYEASVAKIGYRLTSLVKAGKAIKEEVTVAGEDGKNKRIAAYRLA